MPDCYDRRTSVLHDHNCKRIFTIRCSQPALDAPACQCHGNEIALRQPDHAVPFRDVVLSRSRRATSRRASAADTAPLRICRASRKAQMRRFVGGCVSSRLTCAAPLRFCSAPCRWRSRLGRCAVAFRWPVGFRSGFWGLVLGRWLFGAFFFCLFCRFCSFCVSNSVDFFAPIM